MSWENLSFRIWISTGALVKSRKWIVLYANAHLCILYATQSQQAFLCSVWRSSLCYETQNKMFAFTIAMSESDACSDPEGGGNRRTGPPWKTQKYRVGGGGNLRVILVQVCGQAVWNLPQSYTWSSKKNDLYIYLIEQNVYIFIYCAMIFIYPLCCL